MKLNAIDLNKLNVFCTVIESILRKGGYRLAAEDLGLTRAAISQSITTLESQLGKNLFMRMGNRLVPTPAALKLHADLAPFRQHVKEALFNLNHDTKMLSGELKIGCYFEFAKSALMPMVEKFLNDEPKVSLRFRFESPSRLERLLLDQRVDFTISIYPHRETKSIRSTRLLRTELCLIAPINFLPMQPTFEEIKTLPVIDYFADHILIKRWFEYHFGKKHYEPKVRTYAASAEMVLEFVSRRLGIGVVPRTVAEDHLKTGDVILVSPTHKILYDYIWLNEWRDSSEAPHSKEFIKRLKVAFHEF